MVWHHSRSPYRQTGLNKQSQTVNRWSTLFETVIEFDKPTYYRNAGAYCLDTYEA